MWKKSMSFLSSAEHLIMPNMCVSFIVICLLLWIYVILKHNLYTKFLWIMYTLLVFLTLLIITKHPLTVNGKSQCNWCLKIESNDRICRFMNCQIGEYLLPVLCSWDEMWVNLSLGHEGIKHNLGPLKIKRTVWHVYILHEN